MKYKFGGVGSSKSASVSKPANVSNIVINSPYGDYSIVYNENGKLMSDPDTSIYFGVLLDSKGKKYDDVVIKIINSSSNEIHQLFNENITLNTISQTKAIKYVPIKYDYITPTPTDRTFKLITQRVGPSLDKIKGPFTAKKCLAILYQGIEALQALHEADVGFIHNDIKPGNMCIGLRDPQNLKLIDLGISYQYSKKKETYPKVQNRINGTPYYVSPEVWYGKDLAPVSRKHDLQSLLYVILELYNGKLPWKEIKLEGVRWEQVPQLRKQIADYKETAIVQEIDRIRDKEFVKILINYFDNVWSLGPFETPKYTKLLNKIKRYPGFKRDI